MNLAEPIDIRTGRPFADRVHPHHRETPIERASTGGASGRARGLLGGLFGGCMMAAQKSDSWYVTDGLLFQWDGLCNGGKGVHDDTLQHEYLMDISGNGYNVPLTNTQTTVQFPNWFQYESDCLFMNTGIYSTRWGKLSGMSGVSLQDGATIEVLCRGCSFGATGAAYVRTNNGMWLLAYSNKQFYSPYKTFTLSSAIDTSGWEHLVFAAASGDQRVYVNGSLAASDTTTSSKTLTVDFAALAGTYASGTGTIVAGRHYAYRIYSRALTASEVAANYAVDKARFGLT